MTSGMIDDCALGGMLHAPRLYTVNLKIAIIFAVKYFIRIFSNSLLPGETLIFCLEHPWMIKWKKCLQGYPGEDASLTIIEQYWVIGEVAGTHYRGRSEHFGENERMIVIRRGFFSSVLSIDNMCSSIG